jgi:hypothetical protein
MDGTGEHHVKQSQPDSKNSKIPCRKVDLQVKCSYKYMDDYIYTTTHTQTHIHTVRKRTSMYQWIYLRGLQEVEEGKKIPENKKY